MKIYQLTATGYWGTNDFKEGGNKMKVIFGFEKLDDALNKMRQFEHWAKICEIPPYEFSITEAENMYPAYEPPYFTEVEREDNL